MKLLVIINLLKLKYYANTCQNYYRCYTIDISVITKCKT